MPAPPPRRIVQALLGTPKGGRLPTGLLGSQGSMSSYTPTARERLTALIAKGLFSDSREGFRKAGKVTDVAEMSPVGLLTGMYDAGRAAGGGNMMQAGLLGGLAAMPLPPAVKKGIRAYHGSPHSFDKFSMDKIGTGEGAQAYGHGLYFAEGEGVAKSYRDALSTKPEWLINDKPLHWVDSSILNDYKVGINGRTLDDAIKDAKEFGRTKHVEMLQDFKKQNLQRKQGNMYEVNIDADPEQFLDWDKPLKEQPHALKATGWDDGSLQSYRALEKEYDDLLLRELQGNEPPGKTETRLRQIEKQLREVAAGRPAPGTLGSEVLPKLPVLRGPGGGVREAEFLKDKGIPGIKYLDAGSRAKGDGSRNYVVFDENLISIVRKYGIAGASTLLGYDILSNVTTDQAEKLKQAERVY